MLILDLPPQIQTVIEQNAKEAGISAEMLATKFVMAQLEKQERPFNFDLEEMEQAINSGFVEIPKGAAKDLETFEKWLAGEL